MAPSGWIYKRKFLLNPSQAFIQAFGIDIFDDLKAFERFLAFHFI
jgi:hypothetical protein